MINLKKFRYERKFLISGINRTEIESIIKLHPALFTEIFSERYVNNIYFDTFDKNNYFENINGNSERMKVRIRWYGSLFGKIENPTLELKVKKGLLGQKKRFSLLPFKLDHNIDYLDFFALVEKSGISKEIDKIGLKSLFPVILNGYKRKYFLSADKEYRITIDSDQIFYAIDKRNNSFMNKQEDRVNIVVELKYNFNKDKNADKITNIFPFRLSKNSKYVNGVNVCYF